MFSDGLFNKIEKKTNINKETILSLAEKLQKSNMKDEQTLKDFVDEVSEVDGKKIQIKITQQSNIVQTILNDNVPKDIDKMF